MQDDVVAFREKCFDCNRPMSSCLCKMIRPIETKTEFIIIIHPKEFRKIKNNTGRLTQLSLPNSQMMMGIDFSEDTKVNALINDPKRRCYLLYPNESSVNISEEALLHDEKINTIFLIDATWPSARKIVRLSHNIRNLPTVSFTYTKSSIYEIKRQPNAYCLSTMEATLVVLDALAKNGDELITQSQLAGFLDPFKAMISYQKSFLKEPRYK